MSFVCPTNRSTRPNKLESNYANYVFYSQCCFTLSNRFQLTAVGDVQSTLRAIQVGVPQGSILGPLLFLVYINDLPECLEHCEVALYADDTVIYFSSSCVSEIEIFINRDPSKLSSWFSTNRLTLNVSKSKFILIGSRKKLSTCNDVTVVIDNAPLECTDTFKYLGVTINKTMTWGDHVEATIKDLVC